MPRALAAGRSAVGLVLLVRPRLLARSLGVERGTADQFDWLTRMFAVRDLALGLGTLQALRAPGTRPSRAGGDSRTWLALSALCDAGDAVGMAVAIRAGQVRPLPAGVTAATAIGAAATGLAFARSGPALR